jgi:hypothetical protein
MRGDEWEAEDGAGDATRPLAHDNGMQWHESGK